MEKIRKNYWRQFGAWATALKDDPFLDARIKLTVLYTVSILTTFFFVNLILSNLDPQMVPHHYGVNIWTINVYGFIMISVVFISYVIGARTLDPIRRILRAQKRFIADASHELRTPLAIMKTNAEVALLDGDNLDPKEAIDVLRSNLEENDRMSKIIENLLSLSYYDNRYTEIPFVPIDLGVLAEDITKQSRNLAVKKSVELKLVNIDSGKIMGNPIALEQMAINLIKNGVTYTPSGGQVHVSVNSKDDVLEFKVKDSGIGIAEKDLPHVFSPFYKAGDDRIPIEKGSSGLGLTIVRKIVERHNGSIYLNSKLGKGTTISVSFPKITSS